MVIKKKTILKMVLVLALSAAGFWGAGIMVNGTQSGKVLGPADGQDKNSTGSVAGEATGTAQSAKSSILTGDGKSPVPGSVPDFVSAFATKTDGNLPKEEPFKRKVYEGNVLAGAGERRELLKLNFDSDAVGWEKKNDEQEVKVGGRLGQGILIDSGKYTLNKGQTFAASGTISFWLKFENPDANYGEVPILDWNFDDSSNSYQPSLFEVSFVGADKRLYFSVYDDEADQDDISAVVSGASDWHKIDVTWDLTSKPFRRVLYIDGNKVAEGDFPIAPKTKDLSDFTVGGSLGGRTGGKFVIDEIVMNNWAKSENEL